MSPFTFFVLCIQAFLIQTAFSQVISTGSSNLGNYGQVSINNAALVGVPDISAYAQLPVTGPYGGVGTGELSVGGEVTATGQTIVTGQVPVIGTVSFSGQIPASGIVSIAGNCGCSNA